MRINDHTREDRSTLCSGSRFYAQGPISLLCFLLATSGCGSGGSGGATQAPPPKGASLPGYAYVTGTSTSASVGTVLEYAVAMDGSLTPMPIGSIPAGANPVAIAVDNAGHLYVENAGDGSIFGYVIGNDGQLIPLTPPAAANPGTTNPGAIAPVAPGAMVVDPRGKYLYVVNSADSSVSQFSIASSGRLTPLNPASVQTGKEPLSISVDPGGKFAYVANTDYVAGAGRGRVSQYAIGNSGTLSALNPASIAPGGNPVGTTINDASTRAYVLSNCNEPACTGEIVLYPIGSDGTLAQAGNRASTGMDFNAFSLLFDESGTHAWALTNLMGVDTNHGVMWQFNVGSDGTLSAADPAMFSIGPGVLAQFRADKELYVLTSNTITYASVPSSGGAIYHYTAGDDGALSLDGSTPILSVTPTAMLLVGAH